MYIYIYIYKDRAFVNIHVYTPAAFDTFVLKLLPFLDYHVKAFMLYILTQKINKNEEKSLPTCIFWSRGEQPYSGSVTILLP